MRIKNIASIIWHIKHEVFHVFLGLLWLQILNSKWQEMTYVWVLIAVTGSLIPDIDHLLYFFTYGRKDTYTKQIFTLVKRKEWKDLVAFMEVGHKHNTNLAFHNIYVVALLITSTFFVYSHDYRIGTILLGAMVSHFLFDIAEDFLILGSINKNWTRLGRPRKYLQA